jgi:regulator of ribosome biosynthesis
MSASAASSSNATLPPHLHLDAALLLSVDSSPVPRKLATAAPAERDALLRARAQAATQALVSHLYALPSSTHPDHGRIALLPAALAVGAGGTPLPREKPLPAPKAETKWEAFAKRKGINATTKKDKLVWDDDRKEWVPRWGFKGKNKDAEQQWIHELPNNARECAWCRTEQQSADRCDSRRPQPHRRRPRGAHGAQALQRGTPRSQRRPRHGRPDIHRCCSACRGGQRAGRRRSGRGCGQAQGGPRAEEGAARRRRAARQGQHCQHGQVRQAS